MGVIAFILCGLMCVLNFGEFITVGVLKYANDYPFGGEGPTPWYYRSAKLYATVNLIFGILFLSAFLFTLWSLVKKKHTALFASVLLSFFLLAVQYVNTISG